MKTDELAKRLNISSSVIRQWTISEFREYLSPTAQGTGKTRYFSPTDARIVTLIAGLKEQSLSTLEIHVALKQAQGAQWETLPPLPSLIAPADKNAMPREVAETKIEDIRSRYVAEVVRLETRIKTLEDDLATARNTNGATTLQLADLRQELGNAQGKLSAIEGQSKQSLQLVRLLLIGAGALILLMGVLVFILALR